MFEIGSWARGSSRLAHLLYHRLCMAKGVQAHVWNQQCMRTSTGLALSRNDPDRANRDAAPTLTAHPSRRDGPAHDAVSRSIRRT